jgi:adenine-specific DNA-methyltransferase
MTRYQGSKRKILPWIHSILKNIEFDTVLDAFGGSASVSYLFKLMNKTVTYNDNLSFNYLIGKAIIENNNINLSYEDISYLTKEIEGLKYYNFIEKNFKNIYYLEEENIWLDRVISNIIQMNHCEPNILEFKRSLAYYALFQSCMIKRPFNLFHRNNLYLRTSDVERNFGNKTTWDRSFEEYLIKFSKEANSLVFNTGKNCRSLNLSAFDIDPVGFDLVYLDPPYLRKDSSNETSNYLKCYHFLEGLANYNEWGNLIDYNSHNLRFKNNSFIKDFDVNLIYESYEELISRFHKSIIVLSYKKNGIPSIDFLYKLIKKVKGRAFTISKHYKYALNHQNGDAKNNREVIIIGY